MILIFIFLEKALTILFVILLSVIVKTQISILRVLSSINLHILFKQSSPGLKYALDLNDDSLE